MNPIQQQEFNSYSEKYKADPSEKIYLEFKKWWDENFRIFGHISLEDKTCTCGAVPNRDINKAIK